MPILSLAERSLLVFNFLPSRTLHPARFRDHGSMHYVAALAAMPEFSSIWHRRWSRLILQQEGLLSAPVMDLGAVGLSVAVLRDDALMSLVRRVGLVLCAPRLRYAISGEAVRALRTALGEDALHWVKEGGALYPGLAGTTFKDADDAAHGVDLAGCAALRIAFRSAPPNVARRLFLKLPPVPSAHLAHGAAAAEAGTHRAAAHALEREVAASLGSDAAMSLVLAVHDGLDCRGGDGISR